MFFNKKAAICFFAIMGFAQFIAMETMGIIVITANVRAGIWN
jgi:hypothetical protein